MKRIPKRLAVPVAVLVVALAGAGVAYALTSKDFEARATAWQSKTCTEALLKAKETAAKNQQIAICYALAKVQEHDGSIASLHSAVSTLQANQTPQPTDFTFFNSGELSTTEYTYSPMLDAKGYSQVVITTNCFSYGATGQVVSEVSADGSTWLQTGAVVTCNGSEAGQTSVSNTYSAAGRYYRFRTRNLSLPNHVTVMAQFSG